LTPLKQANATIWIKCCQSVRTCPKPPCCMPTCSIYLQWHWHDSHVSMCGSAFQPSETHQLCSVQVFFSLSVCSVQFVWFVFLLIILYSWLILALLFSIWFQLVLLAWNILFQFQHNLNRALVGSSYARNLTKKNLLISVLACEPTSMSLILMRTAYWQWQMKIP
jgi:hypothetical protein